MPRIFPRFYAPPRVAAKVGLTKIRLSRLRDEILPLQLRIKELDDHVALRDDDPQALTALAAARVCCKEAEKAAGGRNLQRGWKKVHRAREALICTLTTQRLRLEGDDLLRRGEILGSDKSQLLQQWLGPNLADLSLQDQRRTVRRALNLYHEHWDVFYQAARLTESRMRGVSGLSMIATAGAILAAAFGGFELVPGHPGGTFVINVVLLGLLGGSTSALVSTLTGSTDRILPKHTIDSSWNILRTPFGGASSMLVVLALGGGLLGVVVDSTQGYYVWAAVAGFSEGLFVRLAAGLAGRFGTERSADDRVIDA